MQGVAPSDAVVVSEETRRLVEGYFELRIDIASNDPRTMPAATAISFVPADRVQSYAGSLPLPVVYCSHCAIL